MLTSILRLRSSVTEPVKLSLSPSSFLCLLLVTRELAVKSAKIISINMFTSTEEELHTFFFFLSFGLGISPSASLGAAELAALVTVLATALAPFIGVPTPRGVPIRLFVRDALTSSKASSTMAIFPLWVNSPASTFQISGQRALTNSRLCEMMQTAYDRGVTTCQSGSGGAGTHADLLHPSRG